MRHLLRFGTFAVTAVCCVTAQAPSLDGVRPAIEHTVQALGLDGAGLVVVRGDGVLHEGVHGDLKGDTVVPIGEAGEWLAVATILSLVEDGVLDLDTAVARYVEEFDRADKRRLTLRACLSGTAGLPEEFDARMRNWDMQRFAKEAAGIGLRAYANSEFEHSPVGMQIVAVAAERATGKSWHRLFHEHVAGPLGLSRTQFGSAAPAGEQPGQTPLPWISGGAVSTLDEYSRFVRMLAAGGLFGDRRVLAQASVDEMFQDQVRPQIDVRMPASPHDAVRYGLGTWVWQRDGFVRVGAPGATGFVPWIDRDLGIGAVFVSRDDRLARVLRRLEPVQKVVRDAVRAPAVAGTSEEITLRHDGRQRRYLLHVPPHEKSAPDLPLLVVLHGGGGNGANVRDVTGLAEIGTRAGFVVAFPDGTGRLPRRLLTWNAGGLDVYATKNDVDDVGFLKALVADVGQRAPIDRHHVYAAGHSNGGMMAHRLAREAADVFSGIAVVGGAMNDTDRDSTTPIAVMLVHGTEDEQVPIAGGEGAAILGKKREVNSLQAAVDYYVARNDLFAHPIANAVDGVSVADFTRPRTSPSDGSEPRPLAPVRVVRLDGTGHAWPGGTASLPRIVGEPHPWSASRAIVAFFESLARPGQHPLPPAVPR